MPSQVEVQDLWAYVSEPILSANSQAPLSEPIILISPATFPVLVTVWVSSTPPEEVSSVVLTAIVPYAIAPSLAVIATFWAVTVAVISPHCYPTYKHTCN